ncbi:MAG TPA: AAA family ATPase [Candidatus Paceibacterota bacterium]
MDQSGNFIPITKNDRARWKPQVNAYMAKVEWADKTKAPTPATKMASTPLIPTTSRFTSQTTAISLIDVGYEESDDQLLMTEVVLHVMQTIRKGLTIGLHLEELYTKSSGLDLLIEQNKSAKLSAVQQAEFSAKVQTRAALTTFSVASYIVWDLAAYRTEEVSNVVMTVDAPDDINFASTQEAIRSTLFYFGKGVHEEGKVDNDPQFVKFALLYFRNIIDAVKLRETGLKCKEPFTDRKYKLDDCDFIVDGFHEFADRSVVSVEFNKVYFKEIVGNRQAKHEAQRIIERLLCYDPVSKRNPMHELGALPALRLGHGVPGTGKSMQIAATATKLEEMCKWIGIPFLFHPFPDNIVSTYQGGSAERALSYMAATRDPSKIIYATTDDAENVVEERTRPGVSAGVREVIGVILRFTEGAYAINRGNMLWDWYTNIPEQIDKAILSRIQSRFVIDGARTENDIMDQDHLGYSKLREIDPAFIDMENPKGYTYLDDQKRVARLDKLSEGYLEPKDARIKILCDKVRSKYNVKEQRFFAALFLSTQSAYPSFSSRDIRNIQTAVFSRIFDFDFPADWLSDPAIFLKKPPDIKKGMIIEVMKANMRSLSFAEIRLEESLRYLDNMVEIADKDRQRKIEALVLDLEVRKEAERRFALTLKA